METNMRAILINPYSQTVSEVETDGTTDGATGFYALLRAADPQHTDMVELVRIDQGIDLWIDENGCMDDGRPVFQFIKGPFFAGAALLLSHNDEGDSTALPAWLTLAKVTSTIVWTDLITSGEFTPATSSEIDHPVFGKTRQIINGDPMHRTARGYLVYTDICDALATPTVFRTRSDALAFVTGHPERELFIVEASA